MGTRERGRIVGGAGEHETSLEPAAEVAGGTSPRRSLAAPTADAATVSFVAAGQVLSGHWRLVREVARGGMGVVFEAEDVKLQGRRVAVKVLPPELAKDEAAVVRLRREATAVAALDHPGIVRLVELNADGDCHYLVMEYLNGDNLALHLAHHERLPLAEVLDVARQVCSALAYAHGKGVLHRDIKPANLMYTMDGEQRRLKVTDFGIASQVKDSMTRLTGQDSAGTLLYVAPEGLQGKRPSAASDQYSLAATLYELLAGHPPFSGAGLSHQILTAAPEPLTGVPTHVDAGIRRALAKAPESRFPDVAAFLAALEGEGGGEVAPAAPRRGFRRWAVVPAVFLLAWVLLAIRYPGFGAGFLAGACAPRPPTFAVAPTTRPVPVPRTVRVTFRSEPQGAKVYGVDFPPERTYVGRTGEGGVAADLAPGAYSFKYVLAGYRESLVHVAVDPDTAPFTVSRTLVAEEAFIVLQVIPGTAVVTLDGAALPLQEDGEYRLTVKPGRHTVAASLRGYEPASETCTLTDGYSHSSRLILFEAAGAAP